MIARNVCPPEAAGSEGYDGPSWDVVRVIESSSRSAHKPESDSRLYYINTSTGLIDKILSQENGENVLAEITSWDEQNGEVLPTRIRWTINNQPLMELTVSNVSLSSR
jgi:hypothetical protein